MTTAIIGTGGIGSTVARQLASGGETLRQPGRAGALRQRTPDTRLRTGGLNSVDARRPIGGSDELDARRESSDSP
jgi:predicted dinucleotide-binding enzyme